VATRSEVRSRVCGWRFAELGGEAGEGADELCDQLVTGDRPARGLGDPGIEHLDAGELLGAGSVSHGLLIALG
jgi:hypothetical protein